MKHIKPLRLFDISRCEAVDNPVDLEEWEAEHLLQCGDCQDALELFVSQSERVSRG